MDAYSTQSNAKRAAERAIASGSAPALDYGIKQQIDGDRGVKYEIVWKTTEAGPPPPSTPERAPKTQRANSKQNEVVSLLRRPEGATTPEIQAVTGWLPHTVRGFIAGTAKKKLGIAVTTEKAEGRGTVYRA
jgi:hypothetical protein